MRRSSDDPGSLSSLTRSEIPSFFLHPGRIFVAADAVAVITVLGSCVAVCLWDSVLRVGAACHFVSPEGGGSGPRSLRHGNVAIAEMIRGMKKMGAEAGNLQAKLFGGASILPVLRSERGEQLGERSVRTARQVLAEAGIRVVAEDVEGTAARKLIFHVHTGDAWVKPV